MASVSSKIVDYSESRPQFLRISADVLPCPHIPSLDRNYHIPALQVASHLEEEDCMSMRRDLDRWDVTEFYNSALFQLT